MQGAGGMHQLKCLSVLVMEHALSVKGMDRLPRKGSVCDADCSVCAEGRALIRQRLCLGGVWRDECSMHPAMVLYLDKEWSRKWNIHGLHSQCGDLKWENLRHWVWAPARRHSA